jgi:hypothetical protein
MTERAENPLSGLVGEVGSGVRNLWDRSAPAKALVIVCGLVGLALVAALAYKIHTWSLSDRYLFYNFSRGLWGGGRLYAEEWSCSEYLYPMFYATVLGLLTWLPYGVYSYVVNVANILLPFVCVFLALALLEGWRPAHRKWSVYWLTFLLASPFFLTNLAYGQVNALILALCLGGLYAARRNRDAAAGILLGLAAAIKLVPGVLLVYFLFQRRWRIVWVAALTFVAADFVIPVICFGFERVAAEYAVYTRCMWSSFVGGANYSVWPLNQSPFIFLLRYFTTATASRLGPLNVLDLPFDAVVWVFRGLGVAVVLALVRALVKRPAGDGERLLDYGLLLTATLLLTPITWKHHYVLLTLLFGLLAWLVVESRGKSLWVLVVGWLLLVPALFFDFAPFGFLGPLAEYGRVLNLLAVYPVLLAATWVVFVRMRIRGALSSLPEPARRT